MNEEICKKQGGNWKDNECSLPPRKVPWVDEDIVGIEIDPNKKANFYMMILITCIIVLLVAYYIAFQLGWVGNPFGS